MPKAYEAMRDAFASEGMDYDRAQAKAARIYNAKHPSRPVTGSHDDKPTQHALKGLKHAKSKAY